MGWKNGEGGRTSSISLSLYRLLMIIKERGGKKLNATPGRFENSTGRKEKTNQTTAQLDSVSFSLSIDLWQS